MLIVQNLTKHYPGFTLDKINFRLDKGRIMGLIGQNGAGKTTTLKGILNLVTPDDGSVQMFGVDFFRHEQRCKQDIGVVFGGIDFYKHKRLYQITDVTKRFYPSWDDGAYARYLDMFSLNPEKRVNELSEGMKVKYMVALALSHNAQLLIFRRTHKWARSRSKRRSLRLIPAVGPEWGKEHSLFHPYHFRFGEVCR